MPSRRHCLHFGERSRATRRASALFRASMGAGASSSPSTCSSFVRSRRRAATTACSRSSSAPTTRRPPKAPHDGRAPAPARTAADNVVYRLGFAASRAQAASSCATATSRSTAAESTSPATWFAPTTLITVAEGGSAEQVIRDATDLTASVAAWLQADHEALTGKILKLPERSEIDTPVQESLIVELYSK